MTKLVTRAFELHKGDKFMMVGYQYIVRRVSGNKIYYTSVSDKYKHGNGYWMSMSAKSRQLIELLINPPDISVPVEIPFELLKYKSNNNGKKH